jgi:hypothetical protein
MMRRAVIPVTYGRGVCLPKKDKLCKKDERELREDVKPMSPVKQEELKQVINNKPANENLINKLSSLKKVKRKITFIP